jgi:DNA-binding NarL/FixJ family response regulator
MSPNLPTPVERPDDLLALVLGFARTSAFSPRETEVLKKYVVEAKANKEIAADLGVTYSTVRLYWTRICRKTACEGPQQMLKDLLRYALLGPSAVAPNATRKQRHDP